MASACCDLAAYSNYGRGPEGISDRQKRNLGQRLIFSIASPLLTTPVRTLIKDHYIGNVVLRLSDFQDAAQASRLIQELQFLAKDAGHTQPLLIGLELENGLAKRTSGPQLTRFPCALSLAACQSIPTVKGVGEAFSNELSSIGINWIYGPVLEVISDLTEPLDALRRFGDHAGTLGSLASAFTQGIHANHVASCAIETMAATVEDVYTSFIREELGEDTVRATDSEEISLLQELIREQCLDSMQFSSSVRGLHDPIQLGRSIKSAIRLLLRERLNFQGPVLLDCSAFPLESIECPRHSPVRALLGECDMVRLSDDHNLQIASIRAIYAAAESAELNESATAAAAARVSNLKAQYTSWDTALAKQRDLSAILSANASLAQATYRSSITILSKGSTPLLNLPPTAVLVLLSPTVPSQTIPANPADAAASDPFEPLGRAISQSHSRTRHVPYTVSAGLTGTHMAFLNRALALVLVLCNASSAFTEAQEELTIAVRIAMRERESVPGAEAIRKVVVAAGDPRDLKGDWGGWWVLCCYEYTRGALEAAAGVIIGDSVATGVLPVQLR